jgi:glycerate dehydrogenase
MRIVVLDGRLINPGDVSWSPLEALGELTVHDRTSPDQIEARAAGAEAVLTVRAPLNREAIRHLPTLRYIGALGSDSRHINVDAARKRGIVVTDTAGADAESTAQHTFALLLELTQGCGRHAHVVRGGRWSKGPDFTFWLHPIVELAGRMIGIVGWGRIGSTVGRIAASFGMRVCAYDPHPSAPHDHVAFSPLEDLLAAADVVSLHCPLTPVTERMINRATLERMRPDAYLINTAHGALIDEEALADALRARRLGGAGLDVLSTEPPSLKNPLLRAPRCIITPHLSGAPRATRQRIIERAAEHLRAYQQQSAGQK